MTGKSGFLESRVGEIALRQIETWIRNKAFFVVFGAKETGRDKLILTAIRNVLTEQPNQVVGLISSDAVDILTESQQTSEVTVVYLSNRLKSDKDVMDRIHDFTKMHLEIAFVENITTPAAFGMFGILGSCGGSVSTGMDADSLIDGLRRLDIKILEYNPNQDFSSLFLNNAMFLKQEQENDRETLTVETVDLDVDCHIDTLREAMEAKRLDVLGQHITITATTTLKDPLPEPRG